ncbi:hypothetical protein Hanom_Chr13g01228441 [Helianthus anomalus]
MVAGVVTSHVAGSSAEVQVELISHASVAAVSSLILPPVFTAAVAVTTNLVSTPLPSSVIPTSLFDSPLSVFSTSEKEMPTVSAAHEATSARDTVVSDAGGSSSGIVDDGTRLGNDLYLPTINWDLIVQNKRYKPKRKIAESSRLIFPPVVHYTVGLSGHIPRLSQPMLRG